MRERFYSDPRIGQSKNTALEIVTRTRARSGDRARCIWLHVDLVHEVPEAAKPRTIKIGTSVEPRPQVTEQKAA
jgi:hypothetical protein